MGGVSSVNHQQSITSIAENQRSGDQKSLHPTSRDSTSPIPGVVNNATEATSSSLRLSGDSSPPITESPKGVKSQYDANIVLLTCKKDGTIDRVTRDAAFNLLSKNPENSFLMVQCPDNTCRSAMLIERGNNEIDIKILDTSSNDSPLDKHITQAKGKARVHIVAHGPDLANQDTADVAKLIQTIKVSAGENLSLEEGKVSLVSCGKPLVGRFNDEPYGKRLVNDLHNIGIETEVVQRSSQVEVLDSGKKQQYDDDGFEAYKMHFTYGQAVELTAAKSQSMESLTNPLEYEEAGDAPALYEDGFEIKGLISCVGVAIKIYGKDSFEYESAIGGHFVTPTMFDCKTGEFTARGEIFIAAINGLLEGKDKEDYDVELYIKPPAEGKTSQDYEQAKQAAEAINGALGKGGIIETSNNIKVVIKR